MGKLLFLVLAAIVIYAVLRSYKRGVARRQVEDESAKSAAGPEDMVRCARCQVNVPRSEAIFSRGKYFCTDEHRRLSD